MRANQPRPLEVLDMACKFAIGISFLLAIAAFGEFTGWASPVAIAAMLALALISLAADICAAVLPVEARRFSGARAIILRALFLIFVGLVLLIDKAGIEAVEKHIQGPERARLEAEAQTAKSLADSAEAALKSFERRAQDETTKAGDAVASAPDKSARRAAERDREAMREDHKGERERLTAELAEKRAASELARGNADRGPPSLPWWLSGIAALFLALMKGPLIWAATPRADEVAPDPLAPPNIGKDAFASMNSEALSAWVSAAASMSALARGELRRRAA